MGFEVGAYEADRPLVLDPLLVYSTYLGGNSDDQGLGIAVDASGNAYVIGFTASTNFPTANALQAAYGGGFDAFVAKVNAAGSALVYFHISRWRRHRIWLRHRRGYLGERLRHRVDDLPQLSDGQPLPSRERRI